MKALSIRCPKAGDQVVHAEDRRACHEPTRVHHPEPVAPPGLPPYLERDKGSAFGPPKVCEACHGSRARLYAETPVIPLYGVDVVAGAQPAPTRTRFRLDRCDACDGNGYANAVRMGE